MAVLRNALTTIAVTALLIGSLIFLFPTAQAATISSAVAGPANLGTAGTAGDETIKVTAVVNIPSGEHIPLQDAVLYGVQVPNGHGGNVAGADTLGCTSATITNVQTSLSRVQATRTGYGYSNTAVSDNGYGYGYSYGYSYKYGASNFDFSSTGYGYGYGYGSAGGLVAVEVTATGCTIALAGASVPTVTYDLQVMVGEGMTKLASLPFTAVFANGACTSGCNAVVPDAGGVNFIGGSLAAGASSGTITITGIDGVSTAAITVNTGSLPAGAKLVIAPAEASKTNPAYGVSASSLTSVNPLARHIQVKVVDQNGADLTTGNTFTVVLGFTIPQSYFTSNPTLSPGNVIAYPFFDSGASKGGAIGTSYAGCNSPCTTHSYTLTLTSFSSYAVAANAAGGGGGGGSPPTTPPATPPTDSDNDGLPDSWEIANFGDITTTTGGADDDGDGLSNAQEYAAGTNPLSRDSDGDGINDGDEVAQGTDPTDPKDPLPPGSTDPGTTPSEPSEPATPGKKDGSRTPGFELVALVGALGAALVFARRRS